MRKKLKRIHVNRHHIAANKRNGNTDLPVFTAKTYNEKIKGQRMGIFHGGQKVAEFVYTPDKPLACGAVAYIETREDVHVLG